MRRKEWGVFPSPLPPWPQRLPKELLFVGDSSFFGGESSTTPTSQPTPKGQLWRRDMGSKVTLKLKII